MFAKKETPLTVHMKTRIIQKNQINDNKLTCIVMRIHMEERSNA